MPQPITKPLIASSNFLEFRYEIVTSTYYHASLCFMTTVPSDFPDQAISGHFAVFHPYNEAFLGHFMVCTPAKI